MNFDWRNNRDFFAGLAYIATGASGWYMALDYPFGSALRMGPGYFPIVLSWIMIVFGIIIMMMGVKNNVKFKGNWSIRALIILPIATAVFGYMMEEAGFLPALMVLIPLSAASSREFNWKEIVPLTIGLTVMCAGLFIYGLGLPYPMIKGLWGY